ncbi:hypothetical protein [Amycolatopsis sp. lyj-90]|uniref:hypothetical protein n=1 Tax=Amycolatopsis sp. lyj-90 TaxID=2789285 RepID=UPI003979CD97
MADTVARYYRSTAEAAPLIARGEIDDDLVARRLDELIDSVVTGGNVSGPQWNMLTGLLCRKPYAIVSPRRTWETLSERLLVEMAVSDGVHWMHRAEGFQRLLAHPIGGSAAIASAASASADRGVQSMVGTVSVLDSTAAPQASDLVVRHLSSPLTDRTFTGALLACIRKVRQGHFKHGHLVVVCDIVTQLLSGRIPARTTALAGAVLRLLPLDMRRCVPARIWDQLSRELDTAKEVFADDVVATIAATTPEAWGDEVLRQLLCETLFADVFDQRLYAQFMIYSTNYRVPVARELSEVLRRHQRSTDWAVPLIEALRVIGGPSERRDVERLVLNPMVPVAIRDAGASALGHIGGTSPDGFWQAALTRALETYRQTPGSAAISLLDRLVYAMGMAGNRPALTRVSTCPEIPARVRGSVRWWLSLPSYIQESVRS